MLHVQVLQPLLVLRDGDPRLEFLPDPRDLRPTLQRCDEDEGVLFTLHATRVEDLVEVAERHEVMSPKTTFVEPKPRTGVFLHALY